MIAYLITAGCCFISHLHIPGSIPTMKPILSLLIVASLLAPVHSASVRAADPQLEREQALKEARYLKSIFKTDEAIARLSAFVTPDGCDEEILSELADCHFQNGDYESAAGTYYLLTSKSPQNILYKVKQMQTFYRMKSFAQSAEAGKAVLQLDTISAIAALIGDSYNQADMPDSALTYYRLALSVKPLNENVVSKAARILLSRRDYDGAIAMTDEYLALDPDNFTIAPIKGLAHYSKNEYVPAVEVFERQENLGNDTYPVHYYLGQCYWHTGVMNRAQEELLAAWQIDSSDVNLAYSIAAVNSDSFLPFDRDVKPWLDKVADMLQPDPAMMSRLHQQYGLGEYRKNNWEQAIDHYKEAYRYNPNFISSLSTIAYCYEQMKDYKTALEWYEKYLKVARPGSRGYDFATQSVKYLKGELFMEEK